MTAEPSRPPTVWSAARSPSFWRSSAPGRAVTHVLLTGLALALGSMPAALVAAPVVDLVEAVQDRSPISVAARLLLLLALAVLVLPLTALLQARFDIARARLVDRRSLAPVVESPEARTRWAQRWTQPASWLRVVHLLLVWVVVGPLLMVLLMLLVTGLVLVAAWPVVRPSTSSAASTRWPVSSRTRTSRPSSSWATCEPSSAASTRRR